MPTGVYVRTLATRAILSAAHMGSTGPLGYRHSAEARARMSAQKMGEDNPHWQGGITSEYRKRACRERHALGPIDKRGFAAKCADLQWVCQLCGKILTPETVTVDHIVPIVKGGTNALENLQPLCQHCNSVIKRDRPMSAVVGSQYLFD